MQPRVERFGDHGILLRWDARIDLTQHQQLLEWKHAIEAHFHHEILETVSSYGEVALYLRPETDVDAVIKKLRLWEVSSEQKLLKSRYLYTIPVCYETPYAKDWQRMTDHTKMSIQEMIRRHSEVIYHVYFIGFLPGFPYLGQLHSSLHTPRLKQPRAKIPKGSVGIGGQQTGIYPDASPGGWNIIGRTPVTLFDPTGQQPSLLKSGDQVQFFPITEEAFNEIEALTAAKEYTINKSQIVS